MAVDARGEKRTSGRMPGWRCDRSVTAGYCCCVRDRVGGAPPAGPSVTASPRRAAGSIGAAYPSDGQGEATVVLELLVDAQGAVTEARVIEGAEPFAGAALRAAETWLFEPASREGQIARCPHPFRGEVPSTRNRSGNPDGASPYHLHRRPETTPAAPVQPATCSSRKADRGRGDRRATRARR